VSNSGSSSAAVVNFSIPQGIKGDSGANATFSVGTVTTVGAGTNAAVTNSGTSTSAVIDFTIPQGPVGPQGNTGATGATGPVATNAAYATNAYWSDYSGSANFSTSATYATNLSYFYQGNTWTIYYNRLAGTWQAAGNFNISGSYTGDASQLTGLHGSAFAMDNGSTSGDWSETVSFNSVYQNRDLGGNFTFSGVSGTGAMAYELRANGANRTITLPSGWTRYDNGGTTMTLTNGHNMLISVKSTGTFVSAICKQSQ
jgi:hypothetical protein